jgi:hypothetical protein
MDYLLDPRTVAEEIVHAVLNGRSDHIVLPKGLAHLAGMRLWPTWLQVMTRKDLRKMMRGHKGRQVVQPSELIIDAGSPSRTPTQSVTLTPRTPRSMESSTVLV